MKIYISAIVLMLSISPTFADQSRDKLCGSVANAARDIYSARLAGNTKASFIKNSGFNPESDPQEFSALVGRIIDFVFSQSSPDEQSIVGFAHLECANYTDKIDAIMRAERGLK